MKLKRPIIILDLETTGVWIEKDRIIEIAMIRCMPDGSTESYEKRINPGMPIPAEASEVTGITDDDVKDAPYFREVVDEVVSFLGDADFGGFNLERFDLPLLAREISDAGKTFSWHKSSVYDAQKIYHVKEKRDLTAAYAFYCKKELHGAHSAMVDVKATLEVLSAQVDKYGDEETTIESLKDFDYKKKTEFFDSDRKFRWWNGELYMMFGKYARKKSLKEVARDDKRYLEWILSQNFSDEVKELVDGALEGHFPQCPCKQADTNDND